MTSATGAATRTAAALAARRRRTDDLLGRVTRAIHQLRRERRAVSFAAVANRAGVSRTFLYENPSARQRVSDAVERGGSRRAHNDDQQATEDQPWRERARNAEDALKAAHGEIRVQRQAIADLLGRIRDLQTDETLHAVGRLSAENTTLHQRVRELTAQNRTLEERLQAARSTARFLDRRVADLEATILGRTDGEQTL
jgi:chromosome segregation ATPase